MIEKLAEVVCADSSVCRINHPLINEKINLQYQDRDLIDLVDLIQYSKTISELNAIFSIMDVI